MLSIITTAVLVGYPLYLAYRIFDAYREKKEIHRMSAEIRANLPYCACGKFKGKGVVCH